jgi:hypothetical protein
VNNGDIRRIEIAADRHSRLNEHMATARTVIELRRWADLALIYRALEVRIPDLEHAQIGLKDVAELCKRDYAARPSRDWNRVRDQLLMIGADWDLDRDRLEAQSDVCLHDVADFLR